MVTKLSFFVRTLLYVASIVLLIACARKGAEAGGVDDVLPTDKLVVVLADLHEADGVMVVSGALPPKLDSIGALGYNKILKQNECTPEQLEASLAYYHSVPDTMDGIYRRVIEVLNHRITNAESAQRRNQTAKRAGEVPQVKPKREK